MMAVVWFQDLLNAIGAVLAFVYRFVPNYGLAIIMLTVAIRIVLLPLAVKQIRSMQAMQAIQPKMKELQKKYKGDRQRLNEEMMKLYKERGVNPLSGCLPLLAQFPILIALFAVLRVPTGLAHIPKDSKLHDAIVSQDTHFLGTNLLCEARQAGDPNVDLTPPGSKPSPEAKELKSLDCGKSPAVRIPYYLFAAAMVGTTYYQQKQMQRASPAGNQQQQALTKVMPLLFGVWGFLFPAGLVIYWTTTNLLQIGQQHFMLPKPTPEDSAPRPAVGDKRGRRSGDGSRKGPTKRTVDMEKPARQRPKATPGGTRGGERRGARAPGPDEQPGSGARTSRAGEARGQPRASGGKGGDRKKRRKR